MVKNQFYHFVVYKKEILAPHEKSDAIYFIELAGCKCVFINIGHKIINKINYPYCRTCESTFFIHS